MTLHLFSDIAVATMYILGILMVVAIRATYNRSDWSKLSHCPAGATMYVEVPFMLLGLVIVNYFNLEFSLIAAYLSMITWIVCLVWDLAAGRWFFIPPKKYLFLAMHKHEFMAYKWEQGQI